VPTSAIADDQPRVRRSLKALLTALRWSTPSHTEPSTHADFFPLEIVGEAEGGLTVPFALVAGLSGAVASSHIVVTAGLAAIAAGAIAELIS
jgi:hypothetical protein